MKKITYLILLFATSSVTNIFGQHMGPAAREAKALKESKFVVVLNDEDTTNNGMIRDAMKKYWTFCEYKFIKSSETQNYLYQDGYYMLTPVSIYGINLSRVSGKGEIYYMKNYKKPPNDYDYRLVTCTSKNKNRDLCNVDRLGVPTILGSDYTAKLLIYNYLIPYIVYSFNEDLENIFGGKSVKSHFSVDNTCYIGDADSKIPKMNLLVCKDGINDEENAKTIIKKKLKIDASKIKFVSSDEIIKAITEKTANTAILDSFQSFGVYGGFEVFLASNLERLASGTKCYIY